MWFEVELVGSAPAIIVYLLLNSLRTAVWKRELVSSLLFQNCASGWRSAACLSHQTAEDSWSLRSNQGDHWACRPISLHVRLQNEEIHGTTAQFEFAGRLVTGGMERQGFIASALPHPADMCPVVSLSKCSYFKTDLPFFFFSPK